MNWKTFPYPMVCTIIFFILGFATGAWSYVWMIWLTIPIYYWAVHNFQDKSPVPPDKKASEDGEQTKGIAKEGDDY